MAVQGSDFFVISRAGAHYKVLASELLAYIQSMVGTSEYRVANIAARNALDGTLSVGDRVMVDDATADGTVTTGWALYQWLGASTWRKIAEQEGVDVSISAATNLSATPSATQIVIVSDTGNDATIGLGDGTNAGLISPAQFTKLANIAVTGPVNLDTILAAMHTAVTTAGTAASNPIQVSGQVLSFSISALTSAP